MLTFFVNNSDMLVSMLKAEGANLGPSATVFISDDWEVIQNSCVSDLRQKLSEELARQMLSSPCEDVIEGVFERA